MAERMKNFLLDTNIFIYHMYNHSEVNSFFSTQSLLYSSLKYSFISRIELLSYPKLNRNQSDRIIKMLNSFQKVWTNNEIEDLTIKIRKSKKLKIPDAIIAASAIYTDSVLVSRNTNDFKSINDLKIINPFKL